MEIAHNPRRWSPCCLDSEMSMELYSIFSQKIIFYAYHSFFCYLHIWSQFQNSHFFVAFMSQFQERIQESSPSSFLLDLPFFISSQKFLVNDITMIKRHEIIKKFLINFHPSLSSFLSQLRLHFLMENFSSSNIGKGQ